LQAVRSAALSALAVAMEAELAKLPHGISPAAFAGTGWVQNGHTALTQAYMSQGQKRRSGDGRHTR
jgi:hypothetical protein